MSNTFPGSVVVVSSTTNTTTSRTKSNSFHEKEIYSNINYFDMPSVAPASLQTTICEDDDIDSDITCDASAYYTGNNTSSDTSKQLSCRGCHLSNNSLRSMHISEECDSHCTQQFDEKDRDTTAKEIIQNNELPTSEENNQNQPSISYFNEKTYTATTTTSYNGPQDHESLRSQLSSHSSLSHISYLPSHNIHISALNHNYALNEDKNTSSHVNSATNNQTSTQLQHNSSMNKLTHKVTFSNVEIRQYEIILGDNPACSDGPPLSLGWNYFPERTQSIPLHKYEKYRNPRRLEHYQLILSRWKREMILVYDLGYTAQDLAESTRYMNKIRHQRTQTVNNLPVAKMELIVEQARGKMKKILLLRKQKKKNKALDAGN